MYHVNVEGKMDTEGDNADTNHVKSILDLHENIAREFREQGLELLNKRRCFDANYARMDPKRDEFFNTKDMNAMQKFPQDGLSLVSPDLLKMNGFISSVHYGYDQPMVKIGITRKLITAHTVHEFINKFGPRAVHEFICGKRGLTYYRSQIVPLDGLDETKNMKSTFTKRNREKITFEEYYINEKKVRLFEPEEKALIVSYGYDKKGKRNKLGGIKNDGYKQKVMQNANYYLPQTVRIIVPMEQQNDATKEEMRKTSHPLQMSLLIQ